MLKKDEDPTECQNNRPLSLLNSDLKSYEKVLARRIQDHLSELVNCDQTGLIKSMLATDNVRHLLHVKDAAGDKNSPASVLSLDAMKACDRFEWPFLCSVLKEKKKSSLLTARVSA